LLAPRPTPKPKAHLFLAVRDCLFNTRSYPPYWEAVSPSANRW